MSSFCYQCSVSLGFGPNSDFDHFGKSGQLSDKTTDAGLGMMVLCEGCGPTTVDHRGHCMRADCDEGGHAAPRQREVLRRAEEYTTRVSGPFKRLWRLRYWWGGTDWEPGYRHHLKWRWQALVDRFRKKKVVESSNHRVVDHPNCRCVVVHTPYDSNCTEEE